MTTYNKSLRIQQQRPVFFRKGGNKRIEQNMASEDYPSAGAIVGMVLAVCFSHYFFPIIHYICIGACTTQKYGSQNEVNVETIDVENQYAISKEESKEIFQTEKSKSRVCSMHFTFWAYMWIIYFAVTAGMSKEEIQPGTKLVLNVLGYIHLPVFVLFLWGETFCSWEAQYLSNMLEEKTCKTYIQELMEQKPVLTLAVVAYHFETRTRTVTYTGANGQTVYGTETYQEKVEDHSEVEQFPFSRWEDVSPSPSSLNIDPGKVTRIKMLKLVILGDSETQAEFDRLRNEMEDKVKGLYPQSIIEFGQADGIPGLEERVCAYWEADSEKWWTNEWVYITMSLLLLTWFHRVAFRFATQSTCYKVVKKIHTS